VEKTVFFPTTILVFLESAYMQVQKGANLNLEIELQHSYLGLTLTCFCT